MFTKRNLRLPRCLRLSGYVSRQTDYNILSFINSRNSTMSSTKVFTKPVTAAILITTLGILSGCSDRVMVADEQMKAIRESSAPGVEKLPEPQLVEDYVYDAADKRSPFMPPSLLNQQNQVSNYDGVTPDLNRTKQPLESYDLSSLVYRGMVISPAGEQFGLIQRPDGVVDSVKVGDYIGMSDGRIVEITPTQINLIEIVPDNRAGFVEKPASVVSPI